MNTLRPWHYLTIGIYTSFIAAVIFWPTIPLPAWPGDRVAWNMYATVHGVCAQVHNTTIAGYQLPLCARNTGIYGAMTLSMLILLALGRHRYALYGSKWLLGALAFPTLFLAIDGFNSLFKDLSWPYLYEPHNALRTLTGAFAGIAVAVFFVPTLNRVLRTNPVIQPVITQPRELLIWWGSAALYTLLVVWGPSLIYWPIAILSWIGIIGILLISNTFAVAVAAGYDQTRVKHLADLVKPFLVATIITAVELGAMSWLRFGFEHFAQ